MLNVVFPQRNTIFLFYNHNHFQQNRIASVGEGTEGFSEVFKNRLVMPTRYSRYDRDHLIAHEFVHIAQFEILYGGFWRSPRLIKMLSGLEPIWIIEGMAENITHTILKRPWSSYDRMILRDAVMYDYLYNLRELQNFNALYRLIYLGYKIGHSAIDFLVKEEGEDINFRLLKSLRNNMDPIKAFEEAAEKFASLRDFNLKWEKDIKERVADFVVDKKKVSDISDVLVEDFFHSRNPVPDGEGGFYYVSDRHLTNEIFHYSSGRSTPNGKDEKQNSSNADEKVLKFFFNNKVDALVIGRRFDRIIDYHPESKLLIFFVMRNQKYYLFTYDTNNKKLNKTYFDLHEPRSPSFSPDGERVVFTALKDSKRNIYIYHLSSQELVRLTDDSTIDFGPVFSNDGRNILVATERGKNLATDIRVIDIAESTSTWLTDTSYNEIHPFFSMKYVDEIYFSADRNSVYNIYRLTNSTPVAITNIRSGAFHGEMNDEGEILFSCYFNESFKIVRLKEKDIYSFSQTQFYTSEISTFTITDNNLQLKPYRFNFSTDFFLPSFLYSSDIGFIGGVYYKGSDILGHHDFNLYGWAWTRDYEFSAGYTLKKWRPDVFLNFILTGEEFAALVDGERNIFSETSNAAIVGYSYPLSSLTSVSNWLHLENKILKNKTANETTYQTETGAGLILSRTTALLEPFHVQRGSILSLSAYTARPIEKYGITYNQFEGRFRKYVPFHRRLTLANNFFLGRLEGSDAGDFILDIKRTGFTLPSYTLRGYPRGYFSGRNIISLNSELRFLIFPEINWHLYFMWPDINIYSLSVKLFSDTGTGFNDNDTPDHSDKWGFSGGFGIKLNFYLMQLLPVFINFEMARPYDSNKWKSYWLFSPGYITW